LQGFHVGACAKGTTGAGEHDDADIIITGRRLHRAAHVALHGRGPRVHAVRPVERDGRDLVAHLVENMLIIHRDLPVVSVIDVSYASLSAAPDVASQLPAGIRRLQAATLSHPGVLKDVRTRGANSE